MLGIVLLYVMLVIIIVETYINVNQNSWTIRGLAVAILLLSGIVLRGRK